MTMTYLEILGWARKGVIAEKENYRQMQEKALEGQAHDIAGHCQKMIDELDVRLATLDEIEELYTMENRFWTVAYRNRDNGQRITAAVFAADQQQAQKKARADGRIDGRDVWEIESIEPHEETLARVLIAEFSKKQQGGHFACPRCGKMTMDAESATHNALSRRATVYICDACGMQEALEDMMDSRTPLTAWAIVAAPGNWRMEEGGNECEA